MQGLNFISQFDGALGIPQHARSFATALSHKIKDLRLIQIDKVKNFERKYPVFTFWYPSSYPDYSVSSISNGAYYIFEYTRIPKIFIDNINQLDYICSASMWAIEILQKNGVKVPCYIVPGGVDTNKFNSLKRKIRTDDIYRLLHVGKAEERKGTRLLLKTFYNTFKDNPKVTLTLMINNPHIKNFNIKEYIGEYWCNNLIIQDPVRDMVDIYNSHDLSVFPSSAEGIGLAQVESMACGLPTILSNNSGMTEYANDKNSILLKDLKEEPVYDPYFFPNKGEFGTWQVPTEKELAEKMIWCYNNRDKANEIGKYAEQWMKNNYTWEIAADKFIFNKMIVGQ